MTINPRVARSVRDVRAKLRDLAVAEHTTAASRAVLAGARVDDEHARLEDTLDEAEDALEAVTSIHQFDDIHGLVASQREAIEAARVSHTAATEVSELSAARLRARTRQLKTAERVVELVRHERARRDSKIDQRRNDDSHDIREAPVKPVAAAAATDSPTPATPARSRTSTGGFAKQLTRATSTRGTVQPPDAARRRCAFQRVASSAPRAARTRRSTRHSPRSRKRKHKRSSRCRSRPRSPRCRSPRR